MIRKKIYLALGICFVGVGAVGVVTPVLPTTPFLLLAAIFFSRSSKRADEWLLNSKYFGSYIQNYRNGTGVPMKTKISSVFFTWALILISIYLANNFYITILLLAIATIVSAHILLLKTKK